MKLTRFTQSSVQYRAGLTSPHSTFYSTSTRIKMNYVKLIALAQFLLPLTLHSQAISAPFEPQIAVIGRGEIKVSPDRATIQISVQTRATTAAAAATEN